MFESLRNIDVFFRDDDADNDIPQLRRLLHLFASRQTPLSLAVIPGTLQPAAAHMLARLPLSFELHQHGWMHANHEREGRKCEFGPARTFAEQFRDIEQGRNRLRDMLGSGRVAPVFTPPWNRCTGDTARALLDLQFNVLSKDRSAAVGMPEMSIAVDLFTWKQGATLKPLTQLATEIETCAKANAGPVGILLHHKVMLEDAFATTATLLDALGPVARFHTLEAACQRNRN
ncbi:polysaccharide deacetylase [Bryobacterales bacterium F-183]|nr:polysaccharide deacetylase [Bryobacterales bacterium F-183]